MKSFALSLACLLVFSAHLSSQPGTSAKTSLKPGSIQPASDHGGKIESEYDGFNHETVATLRKMKITCAGRKDMFKDACVSVTVSLHCPGTQLDYVRYAKLQLIFETEAWDQRHPLDQRDLSVVADGETLRLGRMRLAGQNVDTLMTEVLEVTMPYNTFKKIAASQIVEMAVGKSRFELRQKNLEALRDLNNRVKIPS